MPGMASVPRKGRRDIEPANCLHENGTECTKVRAQNNELGWAAAAMSPCGLVNCKVNGPVRTITDEPCERIVHARVCGGGGSDPASYPATDGGITLQSIYCSLARHR